MSEAITFNVVQGEKFSPPLLHASHALNENVTTPFDIVILGAGPVGLSCALMLNKFVPQYRVAVFDRKPLITSTNPHALDPRAIALNHGSLQTLANIIGCRPSWGASIAKIHVSCVGKLGSTLITAKQSQVSELGQVISYQYLLDQLTQLVTQTPVQILRPVEFTDISSTGLLRSVSQSWQASCVVQAEGSSVDQQSSSEHDLRLQKHHVFGQSAIVGVVRASKPSDGTAFERFTAQGPLALLPLNQQDYSLVWCASSERVNTLLSLSSDAFIQALMSEFGIRLGALSLVGELSAYDLNAQWLTKLVLGKTVKIGNAAQTLHPVAGQGLNLGLRDAMQLVRAIQLQGIDQTLATFDALRMRDRYSLLGLTSLLAQGIPMLPKISMPAVGLGLACLDRFPIIKNTFARAMMLGQR